MSGYDTPESSKPIVKL